MRSIFSQLTFKCRLPKICQCNRVVYLPTSRSQMVTDQNLTGLKGIRKRPPLKKLFNKILAGRLLAAAPGASRAAAGGRSSIYWVNKRNSHNLIQYHNFKSLIVFLPFPHVSETNVCLQLLCANVIVSNISAIFFSLLSCIFPLPPFTALLSSPNCLILANQNYP